VSLSGSPSDSGKKLFIESQKKNVVNEIRAGARRPDISGPTRPGSDDKMQHYLSDDQ
jgi:hypothetical protein